MSGVGQRGRSHPYGTYNRIQYYRRALPSENQPLEK